MTNHIKRLESSSLVLGSDRVREGIPLGLKLDLSVVVPIYNEEECVLPLYQSIRNVCESMQRSYEYSSPLDGGG